MPLVVGLMGSPASVSKSSALVRHALRAIESDDVETVPFELRTLDSTALLGADLASPLIASFTQLIAAADGIVVGTPIYKAAYSGLLKAAFDVLPQFALTGKVVLPLSTGGSLAHVLALDYALRPVLQSMGARHIVQAHFVCDSDIVSTDPLVLTAGAQAGLDAAVSNFSYSLTSDPAARVLGHPRPAQLG